MVGRIFQCATASSILLFILMSQVGCVAGGWERELPPKAWKGARPDADDATAMTASTAPTTSPVPSVSAIVNASPQRVMTVAREVLEPQYGPFKHRREKFSDGTTKDFLLSPRYGLVDRGREFKWIELAIFFNPKTNLSTVTISEIHRTPSPGLEFSPHGGFWWLPAPQSVPKAGDRETRILQRVLDVIGDPAARIER